MTIDSLADPLADEVPLELTPAALSAPDVEEAVARAALVSAASRDKAPSAAVDSAASRVPARTDPQPKRSKSGPGSPRVETTADVAALPDVVASHLFPFGRPDAIKVVLLGGMRGSGTRTQSTRANKLP